jgi:hypothetical protein
MDLLTRYSSLVGGLARLGRLAISLRRQGKQPLETPLNFEHDPIAESRVVDLLSRYSGLGNGLA